MLGQTTTTQATGDTTTDDGGPGILQTLDDAANAYKWGTIALAVIAVAVVVIWFVPRMR